MKWLSYIIILALLLVPQISSAGTYYFRLDGDDGESGGSWALAKQDLQGWVEAQPGTGGVDTNHIGPGLWQMTGTHFTIPADQVLIGTNREDVIIKAVAGQRVIYANANGIELYDMTITGGSIAVGNGGGVMGNGSTIIRNCTISTNNAVLGGGVYGCSIYDSTIQSNYNSGNFGGGIYLLVNGIVSNCMVSNNYAATDGGGIYGGSSTFVLDSSIIGNSARRGGGIYSVTYVSNCLIQYNIGRTLGAAGIYSTALHIFDSTINANTNLVGNGAGMYSPDEVSGCIITSNICLSGHTGGMLYPTIISNTTIAWNQGSAYAGAYGGTYYNCYFSNNVAYSGSAGGGVNLTLYDSVVSSNYAYSTWGGIQGLVYGENSSIINNYARTGVGGVIFSTSASSLNLIVTNNTTDGPIGGLSGGTHTNAIISFNRSLTREGGGAYNCTLYNSRVEGNGAASYAGGLYNTIAHNSIIKDNVAGTYGGGMYGGSAYSSVFDGNIAGTNQPTRNWGGAMYGATASYNNTIINHPGVAADFLTRNPSSTIANTLFYNNGAEANPYATLVSNYVATVDPFLEPGTYKLASIIDTPENTNIIDKADLTYILGPMTEDVYGRSREEPNGYPDIGAAEWHPEDTVSSSGSGKKKALLEYILFRRNEQ